MKLNLSRLLKIVLNTADAIKSVEALRDADGPTKKTAAIAKAVKKSAGLLKGADAEAAVGKLIDAVFEAKDLIALPEKVEQP